MPTYSSVVSSVGELEDLAGKLSISKNGSDNGSRGPGVSPSLCHGADCAIHQALLLPSLPMMAR